MMKHLLTLTALLISSLAMGQWPSLPYNPDENGDGLIGVVDLQGLLANYGSEFEGAVLAEDGESAVVYMGELNRPLCELACESLPGMWQLPTLAHIGLVLDDVTESYPNSYDNTWLNKSLSSDMEVPYFRSGSDVSPPQIIAKTAVLSADWHCYCATNQLPRLEYYKCLGDGSDAIEECEACVNSRLSEGWQLLPPASANVQDLWRWVE